MNIATEIRNKTIDKTAIRTMKKDLQKLQEADILAESEKIMSAKTVLSTPTKSTVVVPPQPVSIPKKDLLVAPQAKIVQQKPVDIAVVEKYASEEEKQRMFALKTQKEKVEQQVKEIAEEKKPEILAKKTKLEGIRNLWKKKLTPLQEKSSKGEQKWSEEKKEWKAEREMIEKEKEIAKSQADYEKISKEESKIKEDARKAEEALRQIYSNVAARKEEEKQHPIPQKTEEVAIIKPSFEEKMVKAATEEDKIRRKFMEDVEKWASSQQV